MPVCPVCGNGFEEVGPSNFLHACRELHRFLWSDGKKVKLVPLKRGRK